METSIIILTYNQLELTKQCLDSINRHTNMENIEIIVIDNGSTDGTVEYLKSLPYIKSGFNKENQGFAKGCNQGYKMASGENILFLNNDTIVTEYWLDAMLRCLHSSEKVGLVGPVSNYVSGPQQIAVTYQDIGEIDSFASSYCKQNEGKYKRVLRLVGFCLLVKSEVLKKIGGFDERFEIGSFEDDDLCLRAAIEGYQLLIANDSFVHHQGHATFLSNQEINFQYLYQVNYSRYIEKWGMDFTYFTHSRPEIINMVPVEAKKILDVGCGAGAIGMELMTRQSCQVYGIELNSTVASIARSNYEKVDNQDIEQMDLLYPDSFFDVIIFADVLEHLKDPWQTVEKMSAYLKQDGSIICSIPNISHAEALLPLLLGNWDYVSAGILDRTHLRFFTPKTVRTLFPSHLFEVQPEIYKFIYADSKIQLFMNEVSYLAEKFGYQLNDLANYINIYQILIHAKKR